MESKGGGPESTLVAAIKMCKSFKATRRDENIELKGLYEWFEPLAIFVVDRVAVTRDVDSQESMHHRR